MNRFAGLYAQLDRTRSTNAKIEAMARYFHDVPPGDAAWALHFLTGQRFKGLLGPAELQRLLRERTGLPDWMIQACVVEVGDLAEAIALLVDGEGVMVGEWQHDPGPHRIAGQSMGLERWVREEVEPLQRAPEAERRERILRWWRVLDPETIYVTGKLLAGSLRVGVSRSLAAKALAEQSGVPHEEIRARMTVDWTPSAEAFEALIAPPGRGAGA